MFVLAPLNKWLLKVNFDYKRARTKSEVMLSHMTRRPVLRHAMLAGLQ